MSNNYPNPALIGQVRTGEATNKLESNIAGPEGFEYLFIGTYILDAPSQPEDNNENIANTLERVFRYSEGPDIMTLLEGYFDESGTHNGSSVVVVGGCLMAKENALAFSQEWQAVLSHYGLPCFHSADFNSRYPPFDKLGDREWEQVRQELLSVALRHVQTIVLSALKTKDYEEALIDCGLTETISKYAICGIACMSIVHDWAERHSHTGRIPFLFDHWKGHVHSFSQSYLYARKKPGFADKFRLGGLTFEDKKEFVPLQAADIIAYEGYKRCSNWLDYHNPQPRFFLKELGSRIDSEEFILEGKKQIVETIQNYEAVRDSWTKR